MATETADNAPLPLLFGVGDAARILGIGRTALYGLIGTGRLATVKLGRRTLIHRAELERFAAELVDAPAR